MNKLYSIFRKGFLAAATIGFMAISAPAQAVTVDFNFSFSNGTDTVSGTIFGLVDNATSAATSLVASGGVLGGGLIEFVTSPMEPLINTFSVLNGVLTAVDFYNTSGDIPFGIQFTLSTTDILINNAYKPGLGFTSAMDFPIYTRVGTVPLPPTGILFGSGLIVLAAMGRRAKRRASA